MNTEQPPHSIAAIIAEIRGARNAASDITLIPTDWLTQWADRIEAAVEREREAYCDLCKEKDAAYDRLLLERDKAIKARAPGNAAAMREALEEQLRYWNSHVRNHDEEEMRKRTEAALAAPARNCDVGTAEEQAERHERFCAAHYKADAVDAQCFGCPASDKKETDCEFVWGQLPFAPAKGKEDDNG